MKFWQRYAEAVETLLSRLGKDLPDEIVNEYALVLTSLLMDRAAFLSRMNRDERGRTEAIDKQLLAQADRVEQKLGVDVRGFLASEAQARTAL